MKDDISSTTGPKEEGKFIDLPEAKMGKVVVRFPPEASGLEIKFFKNIIFPLLKKKKEAIFIFHS